MSVEALHEAQVNPMIVSSIIIFQTWEPPDTRKVLAGRAQEGDSPVGQGYTSDKKRKLVRYFRSSLAGF